MDAELLLERLQAESERLWDRVRRARSRHAGEGPERAALQELRDLLKETAQTLVQQLSVASMPHAEVFAAMWSTTLDFQDAQQRWHQSRMNALKSRISTTVSQQEKEWRAKEARLGHQVGELAKQLKEERERSYEATRLEHAQRAAMRRSSTAVARTARAMMRTLAEISGPLGMDAPSDEVWQLPVLTRALSDDDGSGDEDVRVDAGRIRHVQSEAAPSTVLDAMAHQLRAAADAMLRFREDAAQARARAAAGAEAEKASESALRRAAQAELRARRATTRAGDLESSLAASQRAETDLRQRLRAAEADLAAARKEAGLLRARGDGDREEEEEGRSDGQGAPDSPEPSESSALPQDDGGGGDDSGGDYGDRGRGGREGVSGSEEKQRRRRMRGGKREVSRRRSRGGRAVLGSGAEEATSLWAALSGPTRGDLEREVVAAEGTAGSATVADLCSTSLTALRASSKAEGSAQPSWRRWVGNVRDPGWRAARSTLFAALDAACAAAGEFPAPASGTAPQRGGVGAQVALWWARRYGVDHEMRRRLLSALRALVAQRARGCCGAAWIERVLGLSRGRDAKGGAADGALFAQLWPRLRARCGRVAAASEGCRREHRGSASGAGDTEEAAPGEAVLLVITAQQAAGCMREALAALQRAPDAAEEALSALQAAPLRPTEIHASATPGDETAPDSERGEAVGSGGLPPSGSRDHLALGSGGAAVVRALRALAAGSQSSSSSSSLVPLEQALCVGMAAGVTGAQRASGSQPLHRSHSASAVRRRLRRNAPFLSQPPAEVGAARAAEAGRSAGDDSMMQGAVPPRGASASAGGRSVGPSTSEVELRSASARVAVADLTRASEEGARARRETDLDALVHSEGEKARAHKDEPPAGIDEPRFVLDKPSADSGPGEPAPASSDAAAPVTVTVSELLSARRRQTDSGAEKSPARAVSPVDTGGGRGLDPNPWARVLRRGGSADAGGAGAERSRPLHIPIVREEPRTSSAESGPETSDGRSSPEPVAQSRGLRVVKAERGGAAVSRRRADSGASVSSAGLDAATAPLGGSWLRPNSPVVTPAVRMPPARRGTPGGGRKPPTGRTVRPGEGGRLPKPIRAPSLRTLRAEEEEGEEEAPRGGDGAPASGLRGTASLGSLPPVSGGAGDDFNFV